MRDVPIRDLTEVAVDVAWRAGRVTLAHYQTDLAVEWKKDATPVTVADREAERVARHAIATRFPDHGVVGEELGVERPEAPYRWVLDPIDGTRSFVRGVPLYGVLVAVERGDEALVGVLHFPALEETVWAGRGEGCWWNGRRAAVSTVGDAAAALLLCTDAEDLERRGHGDAWGRLAERVELARTWGDCYGHALVATGRAEAMLDPVLERWDAAALQPVVEEAGGVFTDWSGAHTHLGGSGISTNRALAAVIRDAVGIEGDETTQQGATP